MAVWVELQPLDHGLSIASGVDQPPARSTGKIGVVGTKQLIGLGVVFDLYQPAVGANFYFERVVFLWLSQVFDA